MTDEFDFTSCCFSTTMTPDARIDLAVCCICGGAPIAAVKREIVRGCKVSMRMADYVVHDALSMLEGGIKFPVRALKYKSLAWYRAQIMDENLPPKFQFQARKEMDKLLGIDDRGLGSLDDDDCEFLSQELSFGR